MSMSSVSELESSLISFAGSNSTLASSLQLWVCLVGNRYGNGGGGGGGWLFEEGNYFEHFGQRGTIIQGR